MAFIDPGHVQSSASANDLGALSDVLSLFPDGQSAVSSMNAKIMSEGVLDPAVRILVATTAAAEWSDQLQRERHLGTFASLRDMSVDDARAMLDEPGQPQLPPAEQALVRYISKSATEAFKMVDRDVGALAEHGWTERETVEALTVVCNVAYIAVANLALGIRSN